MRGALRELPCHLREPWGARRRLDRHPTDQATLGAKSASAAETARTDTGRRRPRRQESRSWRPAPRPEGQQIEGSPGSGPCSPRRKAR